MFYEKRSAYIIRAFTECHGYFIRKNNWKASHDVFPEAYRTLRKSILKSYIQTVYGPIKAHKSRYLKYYSERQDYDQMLTLTDNLPNRMWNLLKQEAEE